MTNYFVKVPTKHQIILLEGQAPFIYISDEHEDEIIKFLEIDKRFDFCLIKDIKYFEKINKYLIIELLDKKINYRQINILKNELKKLDKKIKIYKLNFIGKLILKGLKHGFK